jgi:hypothetical protein
LHLAQGLELDCALGLTISIYPRLVQFLLDDNDNAPTPDNATLRVIYITSRRHPGLAQPGWLLKNFLTSVPTT